MMNVKYSIIKEIYSFDSEFHTSYGIAAYADTKDGGVPIILAAIHDITTDEKALIELVSRCNHLRLSTIHLNDIVEDFFAI